jgi:PPOX class probable F420-dependent enzyme
MSRPPTGGVSERKVMTSAESQRTRAAELLSSPEVSRVLRAPNPAVMATVGADGAPVTVATWYLWDGGPALLNLDAGRARLRHLHADPRVSLTVLDGSEWHRHVSLRGAVTLEDDPGLEWIDRIARHYTGRPYPNRERARVNAWLAIERVHVWGFPRLRSRGRDRAPGGGDSSAGT